MMISDATVQPYSLNLKKPWMSADGHRTTNRQGWLITLHSDHGLCGTGDCAPFQPFGSESPARAESTIDDLLTQFVGETTGGLVIHTKF